MLFVEFLDKPHLLTGGLIFNHNLFRHFAFHVYNGVNRNTVNLGRFV